MDFVDKSSVQGHMNLLALNDELLAKVRALASVPRARLGRPVEAGPEPQPGGRPAVVRAEVVAIGTSTGGPPALQAIIPRLPAALSVPLLIVQHMPPGFTRSLAERLDQRSRISGARGRRRRAARPGVVLIAPAGQHMKVRRREGQAHVWLDDEPRTALHRPSIDVLMASVAKVYGRRALGIVLTGMGSDGVEGLRAIRAAGGRTLAESEETASSTACRRRRWRPAWWTRASRWGAWRTRSWPRCRIPTLPMAFFQTV